jgi:hypothetical protein
VLVAWNAGARLEPGTPALADEPEGLELLKARADVPRTVDLAVLPTPLRESEHLRVPALCLAKHAARARIRCGRPSLLFEEVEEHESG